MDAIKFIWKLMIAVSCVFIVSIATAQDETYREQVSFPHREMRIDSLLLIISAQAHIAFSFNSIKISNASVISLPKKSMKLDECLTILKQSLAIQYKRIGNHIVLVDAKGPVKVTRHHVDHAKPLVAIHSSVPVADRFISSTHLLVTANRFMFLTPAPVVHYFSLLSPPKISTPTINPATTKRRAGSIFDKAFIRAGMESNETLYANPFIAIGFPFFYGILQEATNFKVATTKFGAGTSFRLSSVTSLFIEYSSGKFRKSFPADSLQVRAVLTSINIGIEKKLNERWTYRIAHVFNLLTTSYFMHDKPYTLSLPDKNFEKKYYLLHPPVLLSNSYTSGLVSNKKSWIGISASVYYNWRFKKTP